MSNFKTYHSPKVQVRDSGIEGKGVFAKEDIKKGEVITVKVGHILTDEEIKTLSLELRNYCLKIRDRLFIGPKTKEEIEDSSNYLNHSCNPSAGLDGQITYVALRDVKKGEELAHDYAMTTDYDYRMGCQCESKNCRKVITGEDWKRKDLQEKYGNHFAHYILKRIKNDEVRY